MINYNDIKDLSHEELIKLAQGYITAEEPGEVERILCELLDEDSGHPQALFILGKVYSKMQRKGLANTLFRRALERAPERSEVWGSVGNTIDPYVDAQEAEKYLLKALQLNPENESACVNLSNTYTIDNQFEKGVEYAKRALEIQPESIAGHDNLGMSYLALGEWAKGWDGVEWALGHGFRPETQYGDEDRWDGKPGQRVICYGMQGIGDEILYGSCLPDLIRDCEEVILDCDPRLEGLFRRSFPDAHVYGTRKRKAGWPNKHEWDARVAIDTLPRFYRREWEDFPGEPFLKADPVRQLQWKVVLDSISDRPKIGIGWMGGGKMTARKRRSIDVRLFEPLLEVGDLIDLEYEKHDHKGMEIHQWDHATLTGNYDDTAALVSQLDYIVTVPTAIVHAGGGLGIPTYVLKPEKPSWRYAPDRMAWYNSVDLIPFYESWENSIQTIKEKICLKSSSDTIEQKVFPITR